MKFVIKTPGGNYRGGRTRYQQRLVEDINDARVFDRRCDASNSVNLGKGDRIVPVRVVEIE